MWALNQRVSFFKKYFPFLIIFTLSITPSAYAAVNFYVPSSDADGAFTVSYSYNTYDWIIFEEKVNGSWVNVKQDFQKFNGSYKTTKSGGTYDYRLRICDTVTGQAPGNCSYSNEKSINVTAPWYEFGLFPPEFIYDLSDTSFLPNVNNGTFVANTEGYADVQNGSAIYSVPVTLAPATNGHKPSLSLTYNSYSEGGLAGAGWNLTGLSVITRCDATYAKYSDAADDYTPTYTTVDRLCLDGERLFVASSSGAVSNSAYWASGVEYTTEIDKFRRVKFISGISGGIKVRTRTGRTLYYGRTNSTSLLDGSDKHGWLLDKVDDKYGNTYTVIYQKDAYGHRPINIYYPPQSKVSFIYANDADGGKVLT